MTIREAREISTHAHIGKVKFNIARDGASFDYTVIFNGETSFTSYKKAVKYVDEVVKDRK